MPLRLLPVALFFALLSTTTFAADAIPPIPRVLPPEGLEIPAEVRSRLETRLAATKKRLDEVKDAKLKPDVEVFTKAVELALLHREFYVEKDFAKADWALDEANKRLDSVDKGDSPWLTATGTIAVGYRSTIDGSAQPYGLVIPKEHDFSKPCPLYVWLHGRGDKNTDIHFLQERATRPGQITPPGAIVVHPFGRHCVGWKHAGEIDVLEVVNTVKERYKIDPDRVVLIGFSMGGAGAWHIGAHYADQWVAVSPGAGFVDVARYQRITPDKYPAEYVQKLWGLYDVPDYVRNLFNTNVIAYSGELDKQREAAVIMEEAFQKEGRKLTHLIGPGVEHKYEPETLKELLERLAAVAAKGRDSLPKEVHLQTRTLRYARSHWVEVLSLGQQWEEARVDAEIVGPSEIKVTTKNVRAVELSPPKMRVEKVSVNGQSISLRTDLLRDRDSIVVREFADGWRHTTNAFGRVPPTKHRFLQGPIDDAFMSKFVIVVPTGKSRNPAFQAWCESELQHFQDRWRALMRGEAPTVRDIDLKLDEWTNGLSLILWGDADSNAVIRKLGSDFPVKFSNGRWSLGDKSFDGNRYVPASVYPAPPSPAGHNYIVLNSGLTFREGHDRTNSQQNPKLPDWAIIDITQPPDAFAPGRIHDADFFDEQWQLKRQPKAPN